jgi:hypothetical protein
LFLDSKDIRKSNVVSVTTPLEPSVNGSIADHYFPYITINNEPAPSDNTRLESKFRILYNTQKCLSLLEIINNYCYISIITRCESNWDNH